jgi:Xaa-Pro aminopeptidase
MLPLEPLKVANACARPGRGKLGRIAIYGEFGIRLEDCFYLTSDGPRFFSNQSPSIDQPLA